MKMGDIATKLGEVRLDDMKGFGGIFLDKEILWKLMFSYTVNAEGEELAPKWVTKLFEQLTGTEGEFRSSYKHASGVPFGYIVNESTGELEKI